METKITISAIVEKEGKILFVQEAKEVNFEKWNLPGGGIEAGEKLIDGVVREFKEETMLDVHVHSLLGMYPQVGKTHSFNFVFLATIINGEATAGDQILQCKWMTPEEFLSMNDEHILSSKKLRTAIEDYIKGIRYPLEIITELRK